MNEKNSCGVENHKSYLNNQYFEEAIQIIIDPNQRIFQSGLKHQLYRDPRLSIFCCRYEGNPHLRQVTKTHNKIVVGTSVGVLAGLFVLSITSILLLRHYRSKAKAILLRNEKGWCRYCFILICSFEVHFCHFKTSLFVKIRQFMAQQHQAFNYIFNSPRWIFNGRKCGILHSSPRH